MSNPIDPTHSKQDAAVDAMAGVRNKVITGSGQRRRWSSDDKARILRESLKPGAVVSEVAQRYGLKRSQLYEWRRKARAAPGSSAGDQAKPARSKPNGPTPRRLASKQDAAIDAVIGVRDEVMTAGGLRRRRSSDDKARPREPESLKLGAVMSEVAQPPLHVARGSVTLRGVGPGH